MPEPYYPPRRSHALDQLMSGRSRSDFADEVFGLFCDDARDLDGLPLDRCSLHMRTLHPQFMGAVMRWRAEDRKGELSLLSKASLASETFALSPVSALFSGEVPLIEQRFDRPPEGTQYPIYADLRAQGFVHYLGLPMQFASGTWHACSFATKKEGGFGADDVAFLRQHLPPLAMAIEVRLNRRIAKNLVYTYVGKRTGDLVLQGDIARGVGMSVEAAIWTCDLRGFTALSEARPREEVVGTLNSYFDVMAAAVEGRQGEVLKFMGDAMLAIFPLDEPRALSRALDAARDALTGMKTLNAERAEAGLELLDYGVALHCGEVTYGNIGSETRLDFTVIGPAVNETARIEGLCRDLARHCLVSDRFASGLAADCLVPLGEHRLKGVGRAVKVYGLCDDVTDGAAARRA